MCVTNGNGACRHNRFAEAPANVLGKQHSWQIPLASANNSTRSRRGALRKKKSRSFLLFLGKLILLRSLSSLMFRKQIRAKLISGRRRRRRRRTGGEEERSSCSRHNSGSNNTGIMLFWRPLKALIRCNNTSFRFSSRR